MLKLGIVILMFECSIKVTYLSSWGTVTGIYDEYVEVRFNCANVRRLDCYAIVPVDRSQLGDVSIG